jgi:hypothetical protein
LDARIDVTARAPERESVTPIRPRILARVDEPDSPTLDVAPEREKVCAFNGEA